MDNGQTAEDKPKHIITPANWREYSNHMHAVFMERMEIERGTLTEAIFLALEGGGEYGEFMNVMKKMWRDGQNEDLFKKMHKELADILIILDHIMASFNLSATEVIVDKVQELTERWPDIFEGFEPSKPN